MLGFLKTVATPLRNIRVDDALWFSALAKARIEGRSLSDVVRDLLTGWVSDGDHVTKTAATKSKR